MLLTTEVPCKGNLSSAEKMASAPNPSVHSASELIEEAAEQLLYIVTGGHGSFEPRGLTLSESRAMALDLMTLARTMGARS
jgi:hypothetical protein